MPTDACTFFYECKGCHKRLRPLPRDCCIFSSFRRCEVPTPFSCKRLLCITKAQTRKALPS